MLKKVQIFRGGGGGIIFEIAINFTKEIPLKNVGWFQKFGGNTLVNRVQFDGWMVGRLDGTEIFEYTPDRSGPKTRGTRGQASLRSEIIYGLLLIQILKFLEFVEPKFNGFSMYLDFYPIIMDIGQY